MKKQSLTRSWKFWTKLSIGIIPLIFIIVIIGGMFYDYCWGSFIPSLNINDYDSSNINKLLNYYENKNYRMLFAYSLSRNLLLVTTLGNIVFSTFFISSAFNTNNEGKGKIDNFTFGFSATFIVFFIVIFYNVSRLFDTPVSTWYGYVSWIFLHSITQIAGIIYFVLFYDFSSIEDKKLFKNEFIIASTVINGYMIFWLLIGSVLSTFMSFRPFGNMSASGYYPYKFLDLVAVNKLTMFGLNIYIILPLVLIIFELGSIGLYFSLKGFIKLRLKHDRNKIKLINDDEKEIAL